MVLMNSAKPYEVNAGDSRSVKRDHDIVRAWSYIIILVMLLFPEVLTMMYSLYRIIMKPERRIAITSILWVRK